MVRSILTRVLLYGGLALFIYFIVGSCRRDGVSGLGCVPPECMPELFVELHLPYVVYQPRLVGDGPVVPAGKVILQVVVLYDRDGDGEEEGVGSGVGVSARQVGVEEGDFAFTDRFSAAFFAVEPGLYRVIAFPDRTRLFFVWVCDEQVLVGLDGAIAEINCVERFFIRFPWLQE